MTFQGKKRSFTKVFSINLMMVMLILCLSAQVMADVQIKVVDASDSSIIGPLNPGDPVEIYIRLDNLESSIDPENPTIQAIQGVFTALDSVLVIDYTFDPETGKNIPAVEAYAVTAGSETLKAWPVNASFGDVI